MQTREVSSTCLVASDYLFPLYLGFFPHSYSIRRFNYPGSATARPTISPTLMSILSILFPALRLWYDRRPRPLGSLTSFINNTWSIRIATSCAAFLSGGSRFHFVRQ